MLVASTARGWSERGRGEQPDTMTDSNQISGFFLMQNDGQVPYRELSDMACTLRRAVAQNQGADVGLSEFVQLT